MEFYLVFLGSHVQSILFTRHPPFSSQKTLQAKIRSLERQKKTFLEKLEQNPIEQQHKLEKELNDTSRQLRETTQKLVVSDSSFWNTSAGQSKEKSILDASDVFVGKIRWLGFMCRLLTTVRCNTPSHVCSGANHFDKLQIRWHLLSTILENQS